MAQDLLKAIKFISREEEEKIAREKAQVAGLPYVYLVGYPVKPAVLQLIPKEQAHQYQVVAYDEIGGRIRVATPTPENPAFLPFLKQLAQATGREFLPAVCSATSLRYFLKQYEFIKERPEQLQRVELSTSKLEGAREELKTLAQVAARLRQVSTTEILEIIFAGAISLDASDIHFEPQQNQVRLRYRLDGVLQDVANLPPQTYKAILNRIKFLARLRVTSDRPQEGRIEVTIGERRVDVRVSVFPSQWGEATVLRLLNQAGRFPKLTDLGFRPEVVAVLEKAIRKPTGMILVCGPTGSGKTTTLYTILQELNTPERKIITLEDPIEYRIKGIDQSQINPKKGFTFAVGLRSALRQDPDVVMIGEIRDTETAKIALQAAQTGHLVLSTLHTNSAPAALPRLLDLGVEPYLLSGSINLILAQRLVRRICWRCGGKQKIAGNPPTTCPICNGTGYRGRIAIVEVLQITPQIEELIARKASVAEFEAEAKREGMTTMYEDGMQKVAQGITTKEEVERVTS